MGNFSVSAPTWDIVVLVFVVMVVSYGFIIGQDKTMKTLFSAFPSFFIAEGLGNFLPSIIPELPKLSLAVLSNEQIYLMNVHEKDNPFFNVILLKVLLFVIFLVLFTIKAPFSANLPEGGKKAGAVFLHFLASVIFSIFLVTSIIFFLSGMPLFAPLPEMHFLSEISKGSLSVKLFVEHLDLWFAIPPLVLLLSAPLHRVPEEPVAEETEEVE